MHDLTVDERGPKLLLHHLNLCFKFYCDIDGSTDSPTAEQLPTGPTTASQNDYETSVYHLPPPISNRLATTGLFYPSYFSIH